MGSRFKCSECARAFVDDGAGVHVACPHCGTGGGFVDRDADPRCANCRHRESRHTQPNGGSIDGRTGRTLGKRCNALGCRCACGGFL